MDNGACSYRRYLAGDDGGLAEIIREYRNGLIFYLNGFVNDVNAAEDLAEDVFVKLAVKRPRFGERSSFKTWLYAIGRNEAYQRLRRGSFTYTPLDELPETPATGDGPEDAYLRDEKRRALRRCLARLRSEYHQVLWLYYFEEFSAKEIAVIMKRSVHSVDSLLYRARNAVRSELETEGFTDETL
ncbi:MAG: sigma-70 family RNA polymerase sigma factor [Clostridia bacterium]|nr:sigma-70 family RNA polymerase sigma factor [Clostridia bacterium]